MASKESPMNIKGKKVPKPMDKEDKKWSAVKPKPIKKDVSNIKSKKDLKGGKN